MKRQIHTLYLKHDSEFKTLSKIALSNIILKIIYLGKSGVSFKHIAAELGNVVVGSLSQKEIEEAIRLLAKEEKINIKRNLHFVNEKYKSEFDAKVKENDLLHEKVLLKYFGKAETNKEIIKKWFQDTTIKFFEKFSFEWFQQVSHKGKNVSNKVPNIKELLDETLIPNKEIPEKEKEWLKTQYLKFIDSQEHDENLLFWNYGISMFASRLITARNYADSFTIETFKSSRIILDTNVLMILDLEEHELSNSIKSLETILKELEIQPGYLAHTRDEYIRAMSWRKQETINVFRNYDPKVLRESDCPFIRTALKRKCETEEDLNTFFDQLLDLPNHFHEKVKLENFDSVELLEAVSKGENDDLLKENINQIYKRRTNREKRDLPKKHDAGLLMGAHHLREKEGKTWIVTNDSTLKIYGIENCIRDEHEIAIGFDVLLGVLAVNSGGIGVEASNFAPLFKNIVKYSLTPVNDAFEIQDLAFILSTNLKVNELSEERVIEVAKEIKRRRFSGDSDESLSLFLRRVIEGDKLEIAQDIKEAREREHLAKQQAERKTRENELLITQMRNKRIGELRDKYDKELRQNWAMFIIVVIAVAVIIGVTIKYLVESDDKKIQFVVGLVVEVIFSLLGLIPWQKKFRKRYSEYVINIEKTVDLEIIEMRNNANLN